MDMNKMEKICPLCSHHNPADAIYCENELCENDLSLVKATPLKNANAGAASSNPPAAPEITPVPVRQQIISPGPVPSSPMQAGRQCRNCGRVSPLTIMVCPECGSSLSTAPFVTGEPAPLPGTVPVQSSCSWMIVSCDNQARLTVTEGQHLLIGWAGELGDYLERTRKDYVSNRHGMLSVVCGELFFEDRSSNGTLINDRLIPKGQAQKLSAGDILCLGGRPGMQMAQAAYFRVDRS